MLCANQIKYFGLEKFGDTKELIRSRLSKTDSKCNSQMKKNNRTSKFSSKPNFCDLLCTNQIKSFGLFHFGTRPQKQVSIMLTTHYFFLIKVLYLLHVPFEYYQVSIIKHHVYTNMHMYVLFYIHVLSALLLFSANSAMFQRYHGANKLIPDEIIMQFALY